MWYSLATKAVDAVTRDILRSRREKYGQDWIALNLKDLSALLHQAEKRYKEELQWLVSGPGKPAIFMNGLDENCMCTDPADVTALTKFLQF